MAINAIVGPLVAYGVTVSASGGTGEYNEHRGPSLADLGDGMMDPRIQFSYGYAPGQGSTNAVFGFWSNQAVVDFIPGTVSSNNIALNQVPVSGTALTLTASGVTTTSVSIIAPETAKTVSGLICIDAPCGGSSNAGVQFGSAGSINIWNPASVCGRGITIVTASNLDTGGWQVAGRDAYGFKVTEAISSAGTPTFTSKKTYKYISTILTTGTVTSTGVIVGTADLYGFPLYVSAAPYVTIWNGATSSQTLISVAGANHTFGSSLATATATNGDVRGTYLSSVASSTATGVRITMFVTPSIGLAPTGLAAQGLNNVTATSFSPLFGAAQFSSV